MGWDHALKVKVVVNWRQTIKINIHYPSSNSLLSRSYFRETLKSLEDLALLEGRLGAALRSTSRKEDVA